MAVIKDATAIERLDWLLNKFLQRPDFELRELSGEALARFTKEMFHGFIGSSPFFARLARGGASSSLFGFHPSGPELADLAVETLRGMKEVLGGRECPEGCPEKASKKEHSHGLWLADLGITTEATKGGNFFAFGPGFDHFHYALSGTRNLFLIPLATALLEEGGRIARCARESCNRLFVRRKRGKYCSRECASKEKVGAFIERIGGLEAYKEYRHQLYAKQQLGVSPVEAKAKGIKREIDRRPQRGTKTQRKFT